MSYSNSGAAGAANGDDETLTPEEREEVAKLPKSTWSTFVSPAERKRRNREKARQKEEEAKRKERGAARQEEQDQEQQQQQQQQEPSRQQQAGAPPEEVRSTESADSLTESERRKATAIAETSFVSPAERKRRQAQKLKEIEANNRNTDDAVAPSTGRSSSASDASSDKSDGGAGDAAPAPPSRHEVSAQDPSGEGDADRVDSDTAVPSSIPPPPPPPPKGGTTEQQKRAAIQLVMKDKSLSPQERQLAIQKIIKGDFEEPGLQKQKQAPRAAAVDVLGENAVRKLDDGKGGEVPVMDSSSESGSSEEESSEEESGSSEEEESSEEGEESGSEETDESSSSEEEGDEWLSSSSYETEETGSGNKTRDNDNVSKAVGQAAAIQNNDTGPKENGDNLKARGTAETELLDGSVSDSSSYRNPKRRSSLGMGSELTIPEVEEQQQQRRQESPQPQREAAAVDAASEIEPNARAALAAKERVRELEAQLDHELANHSGELERAQKALLYADVRSQSQLERERQARLEAQLDAELENHADLEREQREREAEFGRRAAAAAEEERMRQEAKLQALAKDRERELRAATEESSRRLLAQQVREREERTLREEAERRGERESQFQLRTTDSAEEEYRLQEELLKEEKERSRALAKVQEEREEQLHAMSEEQEQRAAAEETSRRLQAAREREELTARTLREEAERREEQRRLREEESRRLQEEGDAERMRLRALREEAEREEQLRLQEEREREEGRIRALREETEREQLRIRELREERERQEREHREREEQRLLRAEGEREQIRLREEREREEQRLLVLREETERRAALREEREREEGRLRALQEERERHERLAREEQQRLRAEQERLREERETEERRLREQRELHQRLERERIQRSREEEEQRELQLQQRMQEEFHATRAIAPRGRSQHHTSHRASKTLANRQSGEFGPSSTALVEASGSVPQTSLSRADTRQMRNSRYDGVDDDELNWRLDSYASLSDFTIVVHRARPGPYAPDFDTADVSGIDFVADPSDSSSSRPKRDVYYVHKAMIAVGSRRSELLGRRIREAENSASIDDRPSDANVHETVMLVSASNAMGAVLDFLYYPDRPLEIDAKNAVPLVYLGKRYRIRALLELAELYVMDNIESATAMYFLLDSYLYRLEEILSRAIDVTAANLAETVDFGPIYGLPPELFRRIVLSKELECDSELLSLIVYSYCGEHHSEDIDVEYFRELTKPRIMPDIDPKVALMVLKFYVDLVLDDDENCEIMEALQGDSLADRCVAVVANHWQGEVCEPMMIDAEWADNPTPRARSATLTSHHEPATLHRSLPPQLRSHLLEQCILEAKGNVDAEKAVVQSFEGQKKEEIENNAKSFGHIVNELQAELEKSNKSRGRESREYLNQIEQLQRKAAELEVQLERKAKDLEEYKQELRHFRRVPGIHSFGRVSDDDPGIIDKTTCTYSANPDHHYPNHRRGNRRPTQMPDKGKELENLGKENGYIYEDGKGGLLPVYYYHKRSGGGVGGAVEL